MGLEEIQKEINSIKDRNKKVEIDKSWETSLFRRLIISLFTYIVAVVWLWIIEESKFTLKAIVPVAGYILSTITIPSLKKLWVQRYENTSH